MGGSYDTIVVGAGIVGLAQAYAGASAGRRVLVLERGTRATGASLRNFGLVWVIGQPPGEVLHLARRSRELWLQLLGAAKLWHRLSGSLHLARHDTEWIVVQQFAAAAAGQGYECELLTPAEACRRNPFVRPERLLGALFSRTEVQVSPAEVLEQLPPYLRSVHGVEFRFGTTVFELDLPRVRTNRGTFEAERCVVCSGQDFDLLYPELSATSGLQRCRLQMLALETGIAAGAFGVPVSGGLSLAHYRSFASVPAIADLQARLRAEFSEHERYGIHVLTAQQPGGELVVGDSHEYNWEGDPFNRERIDELIIEYARGLLQLPRVEITRRWQGVYARHAELPWLHLRPAPGVDIVNGLGGAGMTLAFGLAERISEAG